MGSRTAGCQQYMKRHLTMAEKEITLIVHADGRVELEGKHFQGKECEKVIADFEKALGTKTEEYKKPQFYMQTPHRKIQGR